MKELTKDDWRSYSILASRASNKYKPLTEKDYEEYFQILEEYYSTSPESKIAERTQVRFLSPILK